MHVLVDADAFPNDLRYVLFRAVERREIPLTMVSNQGVRIPQSPWLSSIIVPAGPDVADDRIVELLEEGDLVVTADIPLADRVIQKGGYAVNPRGELYTQANIKDRLAVRDLMDGLRSEGMVTGGPASFGDRDRQNFANQIDKFLTKHCKR
ncbi:MAG: YaiI/YqxD family protein [Lentisphaerae bacterium]|jgi:uncharacterized protein|nr:YaiI/YqxD family protein [Lentisphaerota bacterium]MBT4820858.1 YaiI/YqxD family protein [Lentisphaerota bacterium]MBT5607296.1 YaiI/YqxD family protein [Lentisphaerota bacterium]MBT7055386.1 YaiI/YqxD family protein [Lentisphaerota bacterium]MBT7840984.1 YaiI/YqxD family protein [Lentisphaerota bacterium]